MIAEAHPEAAAKLAFAGWAPHPEYGVYTRGTLVMGITPDRLTLHVKDYAFIKPDDPRYSADTPDTAGAAAQWLVDLFNAQHPPLPPLADEDAPNVEVEFVGGTEQEEGNEEQPAGEDAAAHEATPAAETEGHLDGGGDAGAEYGAAGGNPSGAWEPTDADFASIEELTGDEIDPALLDAPDLGAEIVDAEAEAPSGAFIFGDNLEQKRTAAIGLVTRIALERAPPWTIDDSVRLNELRNFTMGVAEGRWSDDPTQRDELDTLENTLRMINALTAARDAKVAFLVTATRAEIAAFDPEADWP